MTEYINRELADLLLYQRAEEYSKMGANYALSIIQGDRATIHTIAKADVRENMHGELIDFDDDYSVYDCSVYGERAPNDIKWNYCPNCGAYMRGKEK